MLYRICLIALALAAPAAAQVRENNLVAAADSDYRVGAGDVLVVKVAKNDLLSLDGVRVSNNGTIRLPMLTEEIAVACRTEAEVTELVTEHYRKYLHSPQVYVAVKEFHANPVAVIGAVSTPGRFQLQRPMRLLELLTYVNGPSPNAGRNIQIIRTETNGGCDAPNTSADTNTSVVPAEEMSVIALAATLRGDENANPLVRAGDIVRVTEAEQAFIIGSVKSAMAITLREPVTLSKAIAMAGGAAPGAQLDKIKVSRQRPGSLAKEEIVVNLKDINKQKQDDFVLQANDIVDVPGPSGTRKFLNDIFRGVIPSIARAPLLLP